MARYRHRLGWQKKTRLQPGGQDHQQFIKNITLPMLSKPELPVAFVLRVRLSPGTYKGDSDLNINTQYF